MTIGGRQCYLETFIDNTARKQAEQELQSAYDELKHSREEIQAAYAELAANEQVLSQDYAEIVRNEQKIRESEAQYRLIFDSANDAIMPLGEWDLHEMQPENTSDVRLYGRIGDHRASSR